ncbi:hypothetical protein ASG17_08500 [Brevundimonas sp. Leaf363]|uniref:L,D-transpeptidase family protein n=1 Tax=Brevundimonas sp. Leaf363 TaxID=1736353 RepID=UPI0006FA97A9|nr:L,D-transpeptidase [Brevundimonas sp. Leaf363]KQS56066.1 hypothetical protein ASG17_08500 [Brevundimonas sp. Leaf363]
MTLSRLSPIVAALMLAACGSPQQDGQGAPVRNETANRTMGYGLSTAAIDGATPAPVPAPADLNAVVAPNAGLIRLQILLARARYSTGAVDGLAGSNLDNAVAAYRADKNLGEGGIDAALLQSLTAADNQPALTVYTIAAGDVAGPFIGETPEGTEAQARLPALGYENPREALAEKFHVTQALLAALNPGVDFAKAGEQIIVPVINPAALPDVDHVVIEKTANTVSAYDAQNRRVAFYPATVGSEDRPAPSGELTIKGVAPEPTYTYDPTRLTYGSGTEKLIVAAGPNNPVGSVWIDLSRDTYGIHGTPDPALIGKTASHGCIRLTNWDAEQLAAAVKPGVRVTLR